MANEEKKLLEIENLRKYFPVKGIKGPGVQAVQDVSFLYQKRRDPRSGRRVRMWQRPHWAERFFAFMSQPEVRSFMMARRFTTIRWIQTANRWEKPKAVNMLPYRRKMQIIFQDPSASLDPRMTVGEIIGEAIDIHKLAASPKKTAPI